MSMNGIDISNHQAGLNLAKVPCDFVICKATEGTGFVDRYCDGWIQKALQLGKKVGVYHFATGKSSGVAEADFFYKNIKGYVGKAILVLDWEASAVNRGVAYAKAFLDRIYQLTGVKPLIYMSNSVVHAYDWSSVVNADYGLWNAGYYAGYETMGYNPNAPLYGGTGKWKACALYQYTSSGRLSGWNGNLDLNVFYGDRAAWDKYAGTAGAVSSDPDGDIRSGGTMQERKNESGDVTYQAHVRGLGFLESRCDGHMAGSTDQNRRVEAMKVGLKSGAYMDIMVHLKGIGDKLYKNVRENIVVGTTDQKRRMEAFKIITEEILRYRAHNKTYGWGAWVSQGEWAGVRCKGKQMEAFQIYKPMFLVRGHVQSAGWGGYVGDMETVGTTGKGKRLEALQFDPLDEVIECSAHIQGEGWVHYGVITKDTVIGTVGQADRMECLRFKGNFEFRVHIQGSGWTDWTEADGVATLGTTGQALRIEAIQFRRK